MFGRKKEEFTPMDVLLGLTPSLVEDLASLVGHTEEDLFVSFQVMPWGDRATLAAYDIVDLDPSSGNRGRILRVSPAAVELVNAAAELVGGGWDTDLVEAGAATVEQHPGVSGRDRQERVQMLAAAALPRVDIVDTVDRDDVVKSVMGIVAEVDMSESLERLWVTVPLATPQGGGASGDAQWKTVEVTPWPPTKVEPGDHVTLNYESDDALIGNPTTMMIEKVS